MTETEATTTLSAQSDQGVEALKFTRNEQYTTFVAQFAFKGNDIVFQFFRTPEYADDNKYWKELFPEVLQEVVMEHFNAHYPQLKADFVKEMDSWWLCASDFVEIGDPTMKSEKLFEKLDARLDQELKIVKSKKPLV
jgi:hypothetical protein